MRKTLIGISALLLSAGAINLGLGLQASLLGLRANLEGFGVVVTGLIMSSYYAGFVAGSLFAPAIVNRVGHIRTFSAFASLASAAALCHAVIVEPITWMLFRAITGLCFAALCLVAESWLNERSTNLNRGVLLSTYFIVILGATALGQMLLPMSPIAGYDLFVAVSVIISLALVPVALTSTPTPVEIEHDRFGLKRMYTVSPVGLIGCLGAGLASGAMWQLAAVYAGKSGLMTEQTAVFVAVMIIGGLLTQLPLGKLSDLVDRRYVIVTISFAMVGVSVLLAGASNLGGIWLYVFGALSGGLVLPLYGLSIAHTYDFIETKHFVPASATLLLVYGIGATFGPFIATVFMHFTGAVGLFIHCAVVCFGVGTFALYRITQRAPALQEEAEKFKMVPRTSSMAFELDPRSDDNGQTPE
ncbi:MAG: MFS transporter [Magnetovibrio sp.]|nr:MFS transporter [Magnetovibrio sp.]